MTYIVMECHNSYAVLLDEKGRFVKAANLGYRQGQRVHSPILENTNKTESKGVLLKRIITVAAMVACIALMITGGWQYFGASVGTVRISINPDILMKINRFDDVISAKALNEDGECVLEHLKLHGKAVNEASDAIADMAVELGYLSDGGEIRITVDSRHTEWQSNTEKSLITELDDHFNSKMIIKAIHAADPSILIEQSPEDITEEPQDISSEPEIPESDGMDTAPDSNISAPESTDIQTQPTTPEPETTVPSIPEPSDTQSSIDNNIFDNDDDDDEDDNEDEDDDDDDDDRDDEDEKRPKPDNDDNRNNGDDRENNYKDDDDEEDDDDDDDDDDEDDDDDDDDDDRKYRPRH